MSWAFAILTEIGSKRRGEDEQQSWRPHGPMPALSFGVSRAPALRLADRGVLPRLDDHEVAHVGVQADQLVVVGLRALVEPNPDQVLWLGFHGSRLMPPAGRGGSGSPRGSAGAPRCARAPAAPAGRGRSTGAARRVSTPRLRGRAPRRARRRPAARRGAPPSPARRPRRGASRRLPAPPPSPGPVARFG